ncbi:MAG: ADP-ribosylglycohydrolase [Cellvibrionaceae bacterium]|jgi:ADP-ribosylglycohydrolase
MANKLNQEYLGQHILGGLMGAALGDAMGAATEQHQIDEIIEEYGGLLDRIIAPPVDTFSHSDTAGLVTDDCSQMFALTQALIDTEGHLNDATWIEVLIHWSIHSPMRHQQGPTTKPLLAALAAGETTDHIGVVGNSTRKLASMGTTNGASMRVAPAGLIHPGDIAGAVNTAWISARPTHDTQVAASGAGAIAAGCAEALMPSADVFSVVEAALAGARLGEKIGRENGRTAPGPSVVRRIEMAVEEALRASSFEEALRNIEATVGNSVMMVESTPAAVGIFVAAKGDPLGCAIGGTNIGNDTDTIAAMAGSMAGALRGYASIPQEMLTMIHEANDEDIIKLADGLTKIAWRNWQSA